MNQSPQAVSPFATVPELIAEIAAGRMVVLVDDEGRENEGDVIVAAEYATAATINFMARFCRGLICLTLTGERCDALKLPPMVARNGTKHGTAFTVSIQAATGIDKGISATDRARTVQVAVDEDATASDLVQPGHVFPLRAAEGGVLMRAGHTEAGCDLAQLAGLKPASVICEVMNDDGTMARLPDLIEFARTHGIKLGTIADLIRHRSRHEGLVTCVGGRAIETAAGRFDLQVFKDRFGGVHLALTLGRWQEDESVLVRVHEPLTVLDLLDRDGGRHSWPLPRALEAIQREGRGAILLLNAHESGADLIVQGVTPHQPVTASVTQSEAELRLFGVGAQILRALGVKRLTLLGNPRRYPSMGGFGLQIDGFISASSQAGA